VSAAPAVRYKKKQFARNLDETSFRRSRSAIIKTVPTFRPTPSCFNIALMNYLWGTYPEALSTIAACARQVILIDVRRHRTFRLLPDPEVPCPPWRDGTQGRHRRVVVLHQGYAAAHSTRRPGMTHDTPDADVRRRAPGPTPIAHTRGTSKVTNARRVKLMNTFYWQVQVRIPPRR
jgi:hypothetical protein